MTGRRRAPDPYARDYGLLVPAATVTSEAAAAQVRDLLHGNGIRSTVGRSGPLRGWSALDILVFPEDAAHAYDVLCANTI